jgi:hypothetical protein
MKAQAKGFTLNRLSISLHFGSTIVTQGVDVMLGCASFPGTDITAHRSVMSYL